MRKIKPSAVAAATETGQSLRLNSLALAVAAALSAPIPIYAQNLPTGLQTLSGSVTVSTPTATSMNLNQASQNANMSAQSFSIGSGYRVDVQQPNTSSIMMMNVVGNNPSSIFGTLTANGQFWLVNTAGVLFGPSASVNVGGLVASTMPISFSDATSGRYVFTNSGNSGSVVNQGNITALNGYVGLFAPQVVNEGVIAARMGTVALAAGNQVTLDMIGDGLIKVSVDQAALNAAAMNKGTIEADGGNVLLTARSANALLDTVINTDGVIRANSIGSRNGTIVLDGGSAGIVSVSGMIEAKGNDAGTTGGTIKVLGEYVGVGLSGSTATINASGDAGGGTVLIGGNFQGKGPEQNAFRTYVGQNATINADAINSGDGGKVIVWADDITRYYGSISARGGAQSGDGGFVEVSGKQYLDFNGKIDTLAPQGRAGTVLLDPGFIVIDSATGTNNNQLDDNVPGGGVVGEIEFANGNDGDTYTINDEALEAITGNIKLQANLDITQNAGSTLNLTNQTAGESVTLQAGRHITINGSIITDGANIVLSANDAAATGEVAGVGTLSLGAASVLTSNNVGNGNITLKGADISIAVGATITAGTGTVLFAPSVASRTIKVGDQLVPGQYDLTQAEVDAIVSAGKIQFGEAATQTGAITFTTMDFTGASSTATIEANTTGTLTLDDNLGTAAALATGGSGPVNFVLGAGDLVATSLTNAVVEIATTGAVTLSSTTGDIGSALNKIQLSSGVGNVTVTTTGASAPVFLDGLGALNLASVTTTNGGITVSAAGTLTATSVSAGTAGNSVSFTTTTGGMVLTSVTGATNVTATADAGNITVGTVTATAGSVAITASAGSVVDDGSTATDITSGTTTSVTAIGAGNSVGTAANPIDLDSPGGAVTFTAASGGVHFNIKTSSAVEIVSSTAPGTGDVTTVFTNDSQTYTAIYDDAAGGNLTIRANGNIRDDTAPISGLIARTLTLAATTGGGSIGLLATPLNTAVTTLNASSGTGGIFIKETDGIDLSGITSTGAVNVIAGNAITQSGALTGTTLTAKTTLDGGAAITLDNPANEFTTVNLSARDTADAVNAAGAISYRDATGFAIGATGINTTSTVNLQGGGAITDTGALIGTTLTAKTTLDGGAAITLDNPANEFTTVNLSARNTADNANAAGAISYRDATGFDIGATGINTTSTVNLQGGGAITDTGALIGTTLTAKTTLDGGAAITLDNPANEFTTVNLSARNTADNANAAGAISYTDATGFAIGSTGIETTSAVSLNAVGALTIGANPISGTGVTLVATGTSGDITSLAGGTIDGGAGAVQLTAGKDVTLAAAVDAGTTVTIDFGQSTAGAFSTSSTVTGASVSINGGAFGNTFNVNQNLTADLTGGAGADNFVFADGAVLTGSINGLGGSDTLNLGNYTTALTINLNSAGGTDGINGTTAGAPNPISTGFSNINVFTAGGGGTTFNVNASVAANLTGGAGADNFVFADGAVLTGSINGLGGSDTLNLGNYTTALTINLNSAGGTDGINGTTAGAPNPISTGFSNINVFTAGGGGNTFNVNASVAANLTGGAGADNFVFADGAVLTGSINGLGGSDTLNLGNYTTALTINLNSAGGTDGINGTTAGAPNPISTGFSNINVFTAGGGGNTFNVNASVAANLTGGAGADNFVFADGAVLTGSINGLGGSDTLNLGNYTTALTINLNSAGGTDGINGTTAGAPNPISTGFSNINVFTGGSGGNTFNVNAAGATDLVGGSGNDSFVFNGAGSISGNIVGGSGTNSLNYSAYGGAVTFDLANGPNITTGIGGTWSGITSVTGSGFSDTITGSDATYNLTGANAGNNGTVSWTSFENLADSGAGTFNMHSGPGAGTDGSVSGNISATVILGVGGHINYAGYTTGGPFTTGVIFDLGGNSTVGPFFGTINTGIGGTHSGITQVTGSNFSDLLVGTGQTYNLIAPNAGHNGPAVPTISWTSFENIWDVGNNAAVVGKSPITDPPDTSAKVDGFIQMQGSSTLSGAITSGDRQYYIGPVTLNGDTTITSASANNFVYFASTVDGTTTPSSLAIATPGFVEFDGLISVTNLTVAGILPSLPGTWPGDAPFEFLNNIPPIGGTLYFFGGSVNTGVGTGSVILSATQIIDFATICCVPTASITTGDLRLTSTAAVVNGFNINVTNLFADGFAGTWNLGGIPPLGDKQAETGIALFVGGLGLTTDPLKAQADVAAATASAAASNQAGNQVVDTFGTDSVAEQILFGFAGDIGALPPMDHRLQGVGISVPKCFNESREGEAC